MRDAAVEVYGGLFTIPVLAGCSEVFELGTSLGLVLARIGERV
jgi:hypothetical protein